MLTYKTNENKCEKKSFKNEQGEIITYSEQKAVDGNTIYILRCSAEIKPNTTYNVKLANFQVVNGFRFITLKVNA